MRFQHSTSVQHEHENRDRPAVGKVTKTGGILEQLTKNASYLKYQSFSGFVRSNFDTFRICGAWVFRLQAGRNFKRKGFLNLC